MAKKINNGFLSDGLLISYPVNPVNTSTNNNLKKLYNDYSRVVSIDEAKIFNCSLVEGKIDNISISKDDIYYIISSTYSKMYPFIDGKDAEGVLWLCRTLFSYQDLLTLRMFNSFNATLLLSFKLLDISEWGSIERINIDSIKKYLNIDLCEIDKNFRCHQSRQDFNVLKARFNNIKKGFGKRFKENSFDASKEFSEFIYDFALTAFKYDWFNFNIEPKEIELYKIIAFNSTISFVTEYWSIGSIHKIIGGKRKDEVLKKQADQRETI